MAASLEREACSRASGAQPKRVLPQAPAPAQRRVAPRGSKNHNPTKLASQIEDVPEIARELGQQL